MLSWLFRRAGARKRGRASTTTVESWEDGRRATIWGLPVRSQTEPAGSVPTRQPSTKQRPRPNKLQRRRYSFSPGRRDSLRVGRQQGAGADPEGRSLPRAATVERRTLNDPAARNDENVQNHEFLWRVPTLHYARDGNSLARRKSTKKRRRDEQREAEIRAMCAFSPIRHATTEPAPKRPMRRLSKRIKTGLDSSVKPEWDRFNRSSDISMRFPSIDSAQESDSSCMSYSVSTLDSLSPRPTLRIITPPEGWFYRRPSQRRTKLKEPITEATLKAHKRVDDLANDLSASDLRELMERDSRRKARKKQLEQQKAEQRIARRAEKQKTVEVEARRQGRTSPPILDRGVIGREFDAALGIGPSSAIVTSSRLREQDGSGTPPAGRGEAVDVEMADHAPQLHPLEVFHPVDSIPEAVPEPQPSQSQLPPLATSDSKASLPTKLSRSKSSQMSEVRTDQSGSLRKESVESGDKSPRTWTSLFRWGSKSKRAPKEPPSFTNTSRDSMQLVQPPPPPPIDTLARSLSSRGPKRTMSRFKEDLPDSVRLIRTTFSRTAENSQDVVARSSNEQAGGEPSPQLTHDSQQDGTARGTSSPIDQTDEHGVSPEPQSILSLASIDSEGSWFAGKLSTTRKSSAQIYRSASVRSRRYTPEPDHIPGAENYSLADDVDMTDDDYLARLTPQPGEHSGWNRKSSGEARPSSDWEDQPPHWGSIKEHQPKLVTSPSMTRIKSYQGLLNQSEYGNISPVSPASGESNTNASTPHETPTLHRATSIDYGKSARRISAGSTRLLQISPRPSVDGRRVSLPPGSDGSH